MAAALVFQVKSLQLGAAEATSHLFLSRPAPGKHGSCVATSHETKAEAGRGKKSPQHLREQPLLQREVPPVDIWLVLISRGK